MALAALINRGKLKQEQLEQLKKLEEQLHQEDIDRSTQAGVNIALIAKAFAQKIKQSAGNLRMLYREFWLMKVLLFIYMNNGWKRWKAKNVKILCVI